MWADKFMLTLEILPNWFLFNLTIVVLSNRPRIFDRVICRQHTNQSNIAFDRVIECT